MQGRLQGKRLHARYFLDVVLEHGTEGCNYLLAVDVDMNTVDGYAISSWERGYGDMEFVLDWDTIRLLPHLPGDGDGAVRPGLARPRAGRSSRRARSCRRQLDRVAERGWSALAGTELEFIVFDTTYEDGRDVAATADLTPVNQYNVDYSILGTSRVEPLLRDIRNHMYAAGLDVEGAKGECNFGQHEIGFLYADALTTADNHAVYKTAAKEIAAQQGKAITFMAKYDEREGNSCHIHLSLRGDDGELVFWDGDGQRTPLYDHFVAGVLATMRDFTLLYAPNINSYKRFAAGSFAPTDDRVGLRQPHLRGPAGRPRARAPGWRTGCPAATSTPTSPWPRCSPAACTASRTSWTLEDELVGNAYTSDKPHGAARRCATPATLFAASAGRPGGLRRRRRRPLRRTWPTSSWRPSTPRSPTGSCAAASRRM